MKIINSEPGYIEIAYSVFETGRVNPILDSVAKMSGAEIQTRGFFMKRSIITGTACQVDCAVKIIHRKYYN
ncbi:TPA: hypothetical protein PC537_001266 [Morganella morganii]|nr:hypothetical protein [Morganella morganii]